MKLRSFLLAFAVLALCVRPAQAQPLPPGTQAIVAQSSGTTDCVTNSNCATWSLGTQISSLTLQVTGTATSLTLTFETTSDGRTWVATSAVNLNTMALATTTTAVGQFAILNNGIVGVRARCTTYSSGAVNVTAVRGYASSAFKLFDLSNVTGTLAANHGGTGIASYAVGDMLYASASTTLSKLSDVAAGSYLRSGGVTTAPLWSTLTLPNSATQGDLMVATGANAVGSVAAVASGQVLTSAGTSTVPAYSANPSVTSVGIRGSAKAAGGLCSSIAGTCSCSAFSDGGTVNTWNVQTCTIPAAQLANNGDHLEMREVVKKAATSDNIEIQWWWNGSTCSGTGAQACSAGTKTLDITSTTSGAEFTLTQSVWRTSSGNQKIQDLSISATSISNHSTTTASVTDTNTIPIVFAWRNLTNSAVVIQGTSVAEVSYVPGQ